ncbi:MAG TPA: thioredoxin domain-containing protein [Polyangiaceae bacterium]|nr:thioredoxin domain-containing protein [Polyangiaceae bacterium]
MPLRTTLLATLLSFFAGMLVMYGVDERFGRPAVTADVAGGEEDAAVPVLPADPTRGARTAPVTVVIFSDFQCPFCARAEETLAQLRQNYGPEQLRYVWKHEPLPFHQNAKPAAVAAQAVFAAKGADAFWKFHALAFKNQRELTAENFVRWAQEAGVDAATFEKFKSDPAVAKKVERDHELAAKLGVEGTPHFFINGVELSGAQPYDKFKEIVEAQIEKARSKLAAGTAPRALYAALARENRAAAAARPDAEAEGDEADDAPEPDEPAEDDKTVWKVPVGGSPVRGPAKAPVTVVEFSDYQCPFCKRAEETLKKVVEAYGDKVRLVWKDEPLPFHPRAKPAATLALEARAQKGDKAFWDAHDKIFASAPALDDADLERIAGEMGLDVAKVKDAIAKDKYRAQMEADQALADDLKAEGTPHFFVNGRRLEGAQPFERFQAVIDDELKKAEGLRAKGVAEAKIYDEIMKGAKGPPPPEKKQVPAPGKDQPSRGGARAKVVIQEFSDFECPFCARVEPTLAQILEEYGDKVKLVWRHKPLPMHKNAPLASEAAVEMYKQKGNDGFWKFHDRLFDEQQAEGGLERPALERYAAELGADLAKFRQALDERTHKAAVEADSKLADDADLGGTPAFVINGYFLGGAQPLPKFKKLIDRALADAGVR